MRLAHDSDSRHSNRVSPADAERVGQTLNAFIGILYAARISATVWLAHADRHPIAAKYTLQMTDGTILLTLRKFDDLWHSYIKRLLPKTVTARNKGEWIIKDIARRHLRGTANKLIAHYADKTHLLPLSEIEIAEWIKKNGWHTEQELLMWVGQVIWNMIDVRDAIRERYRVMESMDDGWMKSALTFVVQAADASKNDDATGPTTPDGRA